MNDCILCGKPLGERDGNNPWPLSEEGQCCGQCNMERVIPARLFGGLKVAEGK